MNPFETLLSISEEINSTHDINLLLDRVMGLALQSLKGELVTLWYSTDLFANLF